MNIEISASEILLTLEEREYIRRRLENALSENATGIERVQVWMVGIELTDEHEAHYCLINVKLIDASLLACDGTDAVLKTALDYAVERVSREIARNLQQRSKQPAGHIHGSAGSYRKLAQVEYTPGTV